MEINLGKWEILKVAPFGFKDDVFEMVNSKLHHISANLSDCYYFDLNDKLRRKYDNSFKVDSTSMSAVVGDKVYIFSGKGYFQEKRLVCYDTIKGTWETKTKMPIPLKFSAVSVIDNSIYLLGGYVDCGLTHTDTVLCYDTVADVWTKKANMPSSRNGATSTVVDGKIYVFGGYNSFYGCSDAVECYNPVTDTWETKCSMPNAKESATSVAIYKDIYVIGGCCNDILETYCYDTVTDTWTTKAKLPGVKINPKAFNIDNKIYLVGGLDGNFVNCTKIYVFTP